MHVLVIGGSGLIGLGTVGRMRTLGLDVSVVSRKEPGDLPGGVRWEAGDITDAQSMHALLKRLQPERVVHLASYLQYACAQNPAEAVRVNVAGTLNVLDACGAIGVPRVVFGSSIAVYGERQDLMREDDPSELQLGVYGMTKRFGEMLGGRHAATFGLGFVALRYSGVFGPSQVHSPGMALVRQRLRESAAGGDVEIEGASGAERAQLTHVSDAAEATCVALLHPAPRFHVYNVAGPAENYIDLERFHELVRALAPGAGRVRWSRKGPSAGRVDTTRLREDLGFVPRTTVREGLALDLRRCGLTPRDGAPRL